MPRDTRVYTQSRPGPPPAVGERRRTPRISVLGQVDGWISDLDMPVAVLDVAAGGLGLAVRQPLEVGTLHDIRLSRDGEIVEVRARVANCRQTEGPTGATYYAAGLEVVGPQAALHRLIDSLTVGSPPQPR